MSNPQKVKSWKAKDDSMYMSVELINFKGHIVGRATFSLDEIVNIKLAVSKGYIVEFRNKTKYIISHKSIDECFDVELEELDGRDQRK
jgi:hypothetical protein